MDVWWETGQNDRKKWRVVSGRMVVCVFLFCLTAVATLFKNRVTSLRQLCLNADSTFPALYLNSFIFVIKLWIGSSNFLSRSVKPEHFQSQLQSVGWVFFNKNNPSKKPHGKKRSARLPFDKIPSSRLQWLIDAPKFEWLKWGVRPF